MIQGIVHGGRQPIVGAHVYLFAAGSTGTYGTGVTSLLNSNVLTNESTTSGYDGSNYYVITNASGNFSVGNGGGSTSS